MHELGRVKAITKPPTRWGIPLRPVPKSYAHRVIAAGDAAGQVKPATGGGIFYSLLTSQLAAETLHEALREDDLSEGRLSAYEHSWKRLLGHELRIGYGARRLFERLGDSQMDYILGVLADSEAQATVRSAPRNSFDWHSAVIRAVVGTPVIEQAMRALGVGVPKFLRRE
jgi:flavin-dependent dehydrogenase